MAQQDADMRGQDENIVSFEQPETTLSLAPAQR